MRKTAALLVIGAVAMLSALAMACGDGDGDEAQASNDNGGQVQTDAGGAAGAVPALGMIAPDQFMTFDGDRYELVNLLFEDMVEADEFEAVGEVAESDVDVEGDRRVFRRAGDDSGVYTHVAANAEDPGYWLAWRLVD